MTDIEFETRKDYFTNLLGVEQLNIDEAGKWGFILGTSRPDNLKLAFVYLNTLSRYLPESSNSITERQAEFIFTQLEKLLQ